MIVYFISILAAILLINLILVNNQGSNLVFKVGAWLIALCPLIIISGLREVGVGTDSHNYVYAFNNITEIKDVFFKSQDQGEIGYWFLNYLGHLLSDNYFIIFCFNAIIITFLYYKLILEKSQFPVFSLAVLLLIGPYFFHLNGARQGFALAIYFVSFKFILEKDFIKYLICIAIGFLFHKSIILCLPLYFIFIRKLNLKQYLLFFGVFTFVLFTFSSLVNFASEIDVRYKGYSEVQEQSGGGVTTLFNLLMYIWFLFCKKINRIESRLYEVGMTVFFFGLMINILSFILQMNPSGVLRLSLYFTQISILIFPISVFSFKNMDARILVFSISILFMCIYFYLSTSKFSNLTPYNFNPIIEGLL